MGQLFLFIVVALTVAAIVFGVTVLVSGGDPGLTPVEPDGRALPLPSDRPLGEEDLVAARFDTALRGYRMSQVDRALQRAAYDIGYKGELVSVLEAEVAALREGRTADADVLRQAREAAIQPAVAEPETAVPEPESGVKPGAEPESGAERGAEPESGAERGAERGAEPEPESGAERGAEPGTGTESGAGPGESSGPETSAAVPPAGDTATGSGAGDVVDR